MRIKFSEELIRVLLIKIGIFYFMTKVKSLHFKLDYVFFYFEGNNIIYFAF